MTDLMASSGSVLIVIAFLVVAVGVTLVMTAASSGR
jgi:uncharacterized membrane protein